MNMATFRFPILGVIGALAMIPAVASAQVGSATVACGEEREVDQGLLSENIFNRMNNAFELIGEEQYDEALNDLEQLAGARLSDFEQASVEQALGFVNAQQENFRGAIGHFSRAVELDVMPNSQHFEMILQIAQLYNVVEEYEKALQQLDFWFCVSNEDAKKQADVWALKASLHAQKEEFDEAIPAIEQAIELREDPPESWWRMKLGMHFQLNQFRPAIDTLKVLIADFSPDRKEYWSQLAGAYLELDEQREAMGVMRMAYRRGLFDKGSDYSQLAGLLQEMDAPRQAAEVLQDGLELGRVDSKKSNWEMLAGAWYQAREMDKSLQAYERAGELSDDGKIDFQRASILTAEEDWEEALAAATRALEKGGLTENQEGNAHLLVGMALFNLGNLDDAEQAFNQALNYGRIRSAAREWKNHIAQTRDRLASR